jgi:hypothetical protein
MPSVTVHEETQTERGWTFRLTWVGAASERDEVRGRGVALGGERSVMLTLGWHDYEHWSHGMSAPMDVARAVLEAALEERPELAVPGRVDASTLRRMVSGLDSLVRERLGG